MATEADRLKQDIDATRKDLARDVDRLVEHSKPSHLVQRELGRARDSLRSVKDRVLGASEQAASAVSDVASDAAAGIQKAPKSVARAAEGSPVAVGLIAFGAGLLTAALIPESEAERRAAKQLSETLGPVTEPLQEAGRAVLSDVKATVGTAADQVRASASDAAAHVGTAAATAATDVRHAATDAAAHTAREAADQAHAMVHQTRRSLEG